MIDDVVLLPEVEARRMLHDWRIRLRVLAPYGSWTGYGTLRVLRAKTVDPAVVELIVGYESYRP